MIAYNSSSTGTSDPVSFDTLVTKVAVQPTGACTYSVEGSLTGDNWTAVMASSTSAAGTLRTSTGNFLASLVRVVFSSVGSTSFACEVVGK